MTRRSIGVGVLGIAIALGSVSGAASAPDKPVLAGTWVLNRGASEFPSELGFGMDLVPAAWANTDTDRTGRGGSGAAALPIRRESEDDVRRARQLTDEVKNPPAWLRITQSETVLTILDDRGKTRMFRLDGRDEVQQLDGTVVATTSSWEGSRLVINYKVEQGRELRYTLSANSDPPQLMVQAQFVERGGRGTITRVYDPAKPGEMEPPAPRPVVSPLPPRPRWQPGEPLKPPAATPESGRPAVPAMPGAARPQDRSGTPARPQQPDAELKGITTLGVVVEDLTSQAAACGLRQEPIEATSAKSLSDAGFKVVRNSDEDTYLYVSIMTSSVSPGLCVSRYDVFLYTHTMATLPYLDTPVLVQVSLMHNGGMAGGGPAAHAADVVKSVKQAADEFASRIRNANK